MFRPLEVAATEEKTSFCALGPQPLDAAAVARQAPGEMWLLAGADGRASARCSLWWEGTPEYQGHRIGYVGHYAITDARAATQLLRLACDRLAEKGCTLAVGPVDGNTWQRYRFLTERGSEPPFFLEPDNPDEWPRQFTDFGFTPLAHYHSALATSPDSCPGLADDPRLTATAQRLHDHGIMLHSLDPARLDEELRRIHALSLLSFRENFLYSPISEADFLAQYAPIRPYIRPDLVLLAEKDDELIGYIFGIPDLLQARRGERMNTVILKTLAVHPDHGGMGLGSLLLARAGEAARQAGFARVIHALFHEENRSGRISGHTARVFRRYTLFARPLKDSA